MKQLIIASLIAASGAAMAQAAPPAPSWSTTTVVGGVTLVYQIDPETAQQVGTGDDAFWTAKIMVTADDELVGIANVAVDGCDKTPPGGSTALVDNNGRLLGGTEEHDWTATGSKVYDIMARYTCAAAMLNKPTEKAPPVKGVKSNYTREI